MEPERLATPQRYPDPAIRVLDPGFERYCIGNAAVERIATGMRWVEGPVWFGDHHALVWSDIPNNRLCRWDEATGVVTTSGVRRTMPTATPVIVSADWSPANTAPDE